MKILLLNENPVVTKLVSLSAKKIDSTVETVSSVDDASQSTYDLVIVDDHKYDDTLLTHLKEKVTYKKLFFIHAKDTEVPQEFPYEITKPFLPTELVEELANIEEKLEDTSEADDKLEEKSEEEEMFDTDDEFGLDKDLESLQNDDLSLDDDDLSLDDIENTSIEGNEADDLNELGELDIGEDFELEDNLDNLDEELQSDDTVTVDDAELEEDGGVLDEEDLKEVQDLLEDEVASSTKDEELLDFNEEHDSADEDMLDFSIEDEASKESIQKDESELEANSEETSVENEEEKLFEQETANEEKELFEQNAADEATQDDDEEITADAQMTEDDLLEDELPSNDSLEEILNEELTTDSQENLDDTFDLSTQNSSDEKIIEESNDEDITSIEGTVKEDDDDILSDDDFAFEDIDVPDAQTKESENGIDDIETLLEKAEEDDIASLQEETENIEETKEDTIDEINDLNLEETIEAAEATLEPKELEEELKISDEFDLLDEKEIKKVLGEEVEEEAKEEEAFPLEEAANEETTVIDDTVEEADEIENEAQTPQESPNGVKALKKLLEALSDEGIAASLEGKKITINITIEDK